MSSAAILAIVQDAPDIGTDDADYVDALIAGVRRFIVQYCCLEAFPDGSNGTSTSGASPTADISALDDDKIHVAIDGTGATLELDLDNCDSLANTAAELQTKIRAQSDNVPWALTTVAESSGLLVITSPSYGDGSSVVVSRANQGLVTAALNLGVLDGGTEVRGTLKEQSLIEAAAQLVINHYRRLKQSPEAYDDEGGASTALGRYLSANTADMDPMVKTVLLSHRRMI